MSDAIMTALCSLIGLCILAISFVALAVKGKGNQIVSWRGLGVVFEIKPCNRCSKFKELGAMQETE